jgi:2-polyprenyl-6-hydroxyphenyl methylase/3-demethylubiquinone-9 3-methyltransferase
MWEAIRKAARLVKPGGTFAFALYEKTPVCELWKKEKKFYTSASPITQRIMQRLYSSAYFMGLLLTARNPFKKEYDRGMEGKNDLHDWLGGFPYESTTKEEVRTFMSKQDFDVIDERTVKIHALGVLGSGCSEYVYRRRG